MGNAVDAPSTRDVVIVAVAAVVALVWWAPWEGSPDVGRGHSSHPEYQPPAPPPAPPPPPAPTPQPPLLGDWDVLMVDFVEVPGFEQRLLFVHSAMANLFTDDLELSQRHLKAVHNCVFAQATSESAEGAVVMASSLGQVTALCGEVFEWERRAEN